jgi:predicted O-methyltransferase YrrM
MNKIEFIKENFKDYYIDKGPENGILQGTKYAGCATHCRACLNTLVRMVKPNSILEIGSYHYDSTISMSNGMDTYLKPDEGIIFKDFLNHTNKELFEMNHNILESIAPEGGYDLIFIDGDHSYEGAKKDWEHALKFSHKETLIVIDNIWDIRLKEVRRFYDDMTTNKWDFEEWNDANRTMVQDTGVLLTY